MSEQKILIDLDAIFDTRLGTIAKLNSNAADALVNTPELFLKYHSRTKDDWNELTNGNITVEAFNAAYRERNVETLKASAITNYGTLLQGIINDLETKMIHTPLVSSVELHINTWPYVLNEGELDMLKLCASEYTGLLTEIKTVILRPEMLKPQILDKNYAVYITYNFNDWFGHHHVNLLNYRMPQFTFLAAALYVTTPTEADLVETGVVDLPLAVEHTFSEWCSVVLSPASFFSLFTLEA